MFVVDQTELGHVQFVENVPKLLELCGSVIAAWRVFRVVDPLDALQMWR